MYPCEYSANLKIWLVDTPGFDDSERTDTDVLKELASWLTTTYKRNIRLTGIIYLHRITDDKMQGSAKRNLFMFRKLCGDDALSHVILATTMWEGIKKETGKQREKQLSETEQYWGAMKQNGSRIRRHYNTRESAFELLSHFVSLDSKAPDMVLNIQGEMVDQGKSLDETSAGQAVQADIIRERKKNEARLEEVLAEQQQAYKEGNDKLIKDLDDERRARLADRQKHDNDTAGLKATASQLERAVMMGAQQNQATQERLRKAEEINASLEYKANIQSMNMQGWMNKAMQDMDTKVQEQLWSQRIQFSSDLKQETERRVRDQQRYENSLASNEAENKRLKQAQNFQEHEKFGAATWPGAQKDREAYQQSRDDPSPDISLQDLNLGTDSLITPYSESQKRKEASRYSQPEFKPDRICVSYFKLSSNQICS